MWLWLSIFALAVVLEMLSNTMLTIWFGIGALTALGLERLNAPIWSQWVIFVVVSVLLIFLFRKMMLEKLKSGDIKTNVDEIIDDIGIVTEDIDYIEGTGAVKIKGKIWSARAEKKQIIPKNTRVRILRVEGVKVFVEEIKELEGDI